MALLVGEDCPRTGHSSIGPKLTTVAVHTAQCDKKVAAVDRR
jgi:hypothetical protein